MYVEQPQALPRSAKKEKLLHQDPNRKKIVFLFELIWPVYLRYILTFRFVQSAPICLTFYVQYA